ncbi:MAG TPA: hypothetical protein PLQ19_09370 [Aeromicrobium sp.]|nr:hypothetical protein [Aeromicrobium sp.]
MADDSKPLGFEGNRPTSRKRIENDGDFALCGIGDFTKSLREQRLIAHVLPDDESLDQAVQPIALRAL